MSLQAWQNLTRRPAVSTAILFIAGILCHPLLPHVPWVWLCAAIMSAAAGFALRQRASQAIAATTSAIFFTALAAAQLAAFQFPRHDISAYTNDQPRLARLELELDEPLRILTNAFADGRRPLPPRQVTRARVTRVLSTTGWRETTGRILVQLDPPNHDLKLGQRVRVLGMLQRPSPAMNPGQFDWAKYYREQRILASIQLSHGGALQIIATQSPSPLARVREGVRAALARGFAPQRSLDHALLRALVLGDSDPELRDVQEQFRRTGTSHHLAISGLHVAVLTWFIYSICRLLRTRPRAAASIAIGFVVLYGAVALPSAPVRRSVILCVSVAGGLMMCRAVNPVQLLAVSALALLALHPLDLYSAGFQLSFGAVLGLMTLTRHVEPFFTRDLDARVAMNTPGGNPPLRMRVRYHARRLLGPPVAAGIVAWAVSLPIVAFHFDQLNPWAVLASLLLAIPVFLALIAGFFKIVLTLLFPFAAPLWAGAAAAPVVWMRHSVDWLARLPGSDWPLPTDSIFFVVIYYCLLLLPFAPLPRVSFRAPLKLGPVAALTLFVLIPFTGGASGIRDESLRLTTLAIGAGQCCVLELPDGRVIVIDAGSTTMQDPVRRCIAPYLRSRGHPTIDEIWLADCDYDHMGAAAELIREFRVARVVISSAFERDARDKPAGEMLMETIRQRNVSVRRLSRGDHVELCKGTSVDVLWPPAGGVGGPSNDSDLVMKLNYARRTILLPADIQQAAQATLLNDSRALRCDAMLAPHHGSGERSTADFIAAADPLYIVSSNDRTLSQKQRLFDRQVGKRPLFRTNECGATTITIDRNGGLTVMTHLAPAPAR